jgi:hypothetical protein
MLYDIFISYCHANEVIVHKIANELKKLNYKIWIDIDMMNGKNSNDDIQQGINNSHLFICFVSKAYCKSNSCYKEITYSEGKKIMLPITLDDYFQKQECEIGMLLKPLNKFYAHKEGKKFSPWSGDHFERLKEKIKMKSKICSSVTVSRFNRIIYYVSRFISFAKMLITCVVIAIYLIAIILILFF